jgi:hypothetical protein
LGSQLNDYLPWLFRLKVNSQAIIGSINVGWCVFSFHFDPKRRKSIWPVEYEDGLYFNPRGEARFMNREMGAGG